MHGALDAAVRWEDFLFMLIVVRFEVLIAWRSVGTVSIATTLFELKEK